MPRVPVRGTDAVSEADARLHAMSLTGLTLDHWRTLDRGTATRYAEEAAHRVDGRFVRLDAAPRPGGAHRALIERAGDTYALIPGGTVTVGFDPEAWRPLPEQLASYREESLAGGFGFDEDPRDHLARVLSPRRTATLPTVLMAVQAAPLPGAPGLVPGLLAERGLRLPSPEEWEHACGAGATTLFHWGDAYPADTVPYGTDSTGPHRLPNALGLCVAFDVYDSAELTSDPRSVYGGDGGEAACGGYGTFLEWLPLATAHRSRSMADLLDDQEDEEASDYVTARPVIDLS